MPESMQPSAASSAAGEPFDPAAVLAGRPSGRTPVAFIVATAATAACAIVALGLDAVQALADGDGPAPFAIALPLALLPVPLLVSVVLCMDRLEPEPRANLAFAFGWGAGIAALAALLIWVAYPGPRRAAGPTLPTSTWRSLPNRPFGNEMSQR